MNPFPSPQQMVAQVTAPPSGGGSSSFATILMTDIFFCLSTQAKNYDQSEGCSTMSDTPSTSQPDHPLTLEKPAFKLPSLPSNVTIGRYTHNFHTKATQHYSIV